MKMKVIDTEINVIKNGKEDYISLTDMIKAKDGDFFITRSLIKRGDMAAHFAGKSVCGTDQIQ